MQCIDFDREFARFTRTWMEAQEDEAGSPDDLEAQMPEVYARFLDSPADWLSGEKPGAFFDKWDDPDLLVDWIGDYLKQRVSLPDMLLNRVTALGDAAAPALMGMLLDAGATAEKQMLAIGLLRETGSLLPMQQYIDWQCERRYEDELCDNALESLEGMGEEALPGMLEALEGASHAGQEALLSILSRYPGDERILEKLLELFLLHPERRAILAAYLGRLGDLRALPVLREAANDEGLGYLDYIEIRSAIEALGGEAPEREFDEDAEYGALFGSTEAQDKREGERRSET
ncbi:MAG: hypothetical protein AB9880_06715 [Christensenellales bacterium]